MSARNPEELERLLATAERRAAELQAWVDNSEAEAEQLRARIEELQALPPPAPSGDGGNKKIDELQEWLKAAEDEAEQLRARVDELEARPPPATAPGDGGNKKIDELQEWLKAAEDEAERLRARVDELEARPPAATPAEVDQKKADELQEWLNAAEAESDQLREKVAELETKLGNGQGQTNQQTNELQEWLDAAEAENAKLKAQLTLARDGTEADRQNAVLKERVAELEAQLHSAKSLADRFSNEAATSAQREIDRITRELSLAKRSSDKKREQEFQVELTRAQVTLALLVRERYSALEQVKRYAQADQQSSASSSQSASSQLAYEIGVRDKRIAELEEAQSENIGQIGALEERVRAYDASDKRHAKEAEESRQRAAEGDRLAAHLKGEVERLTSEKAAVEALLADARASLVEVRAKLVQSEKANTQLQQELAKTHAIPDARSEASSQTKIIEKTVRVKADGAPDDDNEGFSLQRLRQLESQLENEILRAKGLQLQLDVAQRAIDAVSDRLIAAGGLIADLKKRLGLSDDEFGSTQEALDAAWRELFALKKELGKKPNELQAPGAQPTGAAAADAFNNQLTALDDMAEAQGTAVREATVALQGEQRAREMLIGDLNWLKDQLSLVTGIREELRARVAAMVVRELSRRNTVSALLDKLRKTEVVAASRIATLKRLHAAIEESQKMAVKVQTIYFQKQIGSLQRQLESALGQKRPLAKV